MSKITIRDVAHAAGVGVGTVSRVLNNSSHVSDKTRQSVLTIIEKLGYRPNAVARQLPRKTNLQTIGVMTRPFQEYYSFAERLRGSQRALHPYEADFDLALYTSLGFHISDERFNFIIENSLIVGLILIDLDMTTVQKNLLRQLGIHCVGINHYQSPDWARIGTDNIYGGYLAGKHLVELGHRKIAYVGNAMIDEEGYPTSQDRFEGCLTALAEIGGTIPPHYVGLGEQHFESAKHFALEILSQKDRPTAIFAMSDSQALACIAAAKELGLRVPDDLSVIGYDDLALSYQIGLTSVRQHLELSGALAMDYLIKLINGESSPIPDLPPVEVIARETTKSIL